MPSYLALRREAERLFHARDSFGALRIYRRLLDAHPEDFQVRLHVGDALVRLGQRPRARQVFAALSLLHMQAGRTLPALLAAKALDEIEPGSTHVFEKMARLYGAGSERTRHSAAPTALQPLPDLELGRGPTDTPPAELLQTAAAAAASLQGRVERVGPLPPLPIFSDLDAEDVLLVLRTMQRVRFAEGERILQQGEQGSTFYLVAHGHVLVTREEDGRTLELARLSQGAVLGEMALVCGKPRSASATALEEVDGLEVPYPVLQELATRRTGVAHALRRFTVHRLIRGVMLRSPLLHPFYPDRIDELMELFAPKCYAAGESLLKEGDVGDGLHVLLAGEVDVFRWNGQRQVRVARLGPAEIVGEMSLLDAGAVSATVTARDAVQTLFLSRGSFQRLIGAQPALVEQLRMLAETRKVENMLLLPPEPDEVGYLSTGEHEVLL